MVRSDFATASPRYISKSHLHLDISNQNYLIDEILYADGRYIYALGRYVHDDNRAQQGVTMRLTLDTMRYEVILPDRFWEYSAKTAS